jgi:hypothetical protein
MTVVGELHACQIELENVEGDPLSKVTKACTEVADCIEAAGKFVKKLKMEGVNAVAKDEHEISEIVTTLRNWMEQTSQPNKADQVKKLKRAVAINRRSQARRIGSPAPPVKGVMRSNEALLQNAKTFIMGFVQWLYDLLESYEIEEEPVVESEQPEEAPEPKSPKKKPKKKEKNDGEEV